MDAVYIWRPDLQDVDWMFFCLLRGTTYHPNLLRYHDLIMIKQRLERVLQSFSASHVILKHHVLDV